MNWPPEQSKTALAILISGGIDSAILLGEALKHYPEVYPIYIRTGLFWEEVELLHLHRFLRRISGESLMPLQVLHQPIEDVYGSHWSITGIGIPGEDTPDEAVFLPGRNVLLLAKALLWCHLRGIPELAMAPLEANPFPDATPTFFAEFSGAVNRAVDGKVSILRPYAQLTKRVVLERGKDLPLEDTFSCIRPIASQHCGHCNKCAERKKAFTEAGFPDPTVYSVIVS